MSFDIMFDVFLIMITVCVQTPLPGQCLRSNNPQCILAQSWKDAPHNWSDTMLYCLVGDVVYSGACLLGDVVYFCGLYDGCFVFVGGEWVLVLVNPSLLWHDLFHCFLTSHKLASWWNILFLMLARFMKALQADVLIVVFGYHYASLQSLSNYNWIEYI